MRGEAHFPTSSIYFTLILKEIVLRIYCCPSNCGIPVLYKILLIRLAVWFIIRFMKLFLMFLYLSSSILLFTYEPEILDLRVEMRSSTPPIIIDVRDTEDFDNDHIPTSINIPLEYLTLKLLEEKNINIGTSIYVYCNKGITSKKAKKYLEDFGYQKVTDLSSIKNWLFGTVGTYSNNNDLVRSKSNE